MEEIYITIKSSCEACGKIDKVKLKQKDVEVRCNTATSIGAYSIIHADHSRIIYFDKNGKYIGDTIILK